ncbi:MAG: PRC-barrel domain containing protein [Actinobacteria bacterium]|nr:PRC-barrel domain containing protein [Actinomycetota bacterium]
MNPIEAVDVAGFDVEARDGHIGKVDEATYETGASFLVVDTGFWIFGKKRMIPAGLVERVDADEKKVFLSVTKDDVKAAPDFDPKRVQDAGYQAEVGDHYQRVSR